MEYHGNKGIFKETRVHILTHMRKIQVDEYITLILEFARRTGVNASHIMELKEQIVPVEKS